MAKLYLERMGGWWRSMALETSDRFVVVGKLGRVGWLLPLKT